MKSPTNWDWYGTWVIDWLTCDRDDGWESFDIWKTAYVRANPDLSEENDLELMEHYGPAMEPIFKSWIFATYLALQWPMKVFHSLAWTVKRLHS